MLQILQPQDVNNADIVQLGAWFNDMTAQANALKKNIDTIKKTIENKMGECDELHITGTSKRFVKEKRVKTEINKDKLGTIFDEDVLLRIASFTSKDVLNQLIEKYGDKNEAQKQLSEVTEVTGETFSIKIK